MKKVISLILVVAMILACGVISFAAEEKPTATVSEVGAVNRGEEFEVKISLSNNPGVAYLSIPLNFDTDVFERVSVKGSGLEGSWQYGNKPTFMGEDSYFNGVVLTIKFKVKDDAAFGEYVIGIDGLTANNYDEEIVEFATVSGGVTVVCENHTFTAETATDDYKATDATCAKKATYYKSCVDCGLSSKDQEGEVTFEAGEFDNENHDPEAGWKTENGEHYHVCKNGCGTKIGLEKCSGGKATCTEKAFCDYCGVEYGEMLSHSFTEEKADEKYLASEATCTAKATYYKSCVCGLSSKGQDGEAVFEHGELDSENHNPAENWEHEDGEDGQYHYHVCLNQCEAKLDYARCSGGEATCTEKATCSVCGEKYGETAPHVFDQKVEHVDYEAGAQSCTEPATYYYSCVCGLSSEGQEGEATFESGKAAGHVWGSVEYTWTGDIENGYECTAEATCTRNPNLCQATATETVKAACETTYGNCVTATVYNYTADFEAEWAATQTKEVVGEIAEDAHNYDDKIVYKWNEDYTACTATKVCNNSEEHNIVIRATIEEDVYETTCEKDGKTVYTATFDENYGWAKPQTKEVAGEPATDHNFGGAIYAWNGYESCTATRKCLNDHCDVEGGKIETATAEITSEVKDAATCMKEGLEVYTATFSADWAEKQTKDKTLAVNPDAHHYVYKTTLEPTCTEEGKETVTCDNKNEAGETCTYKNENGTIGKLGHDWGDWKEVVKPTYSAEGLERRDCERENCDAYEERKIKKLEEDDDGPKEGITDIIGRPENEAEFNPNTGAPVTGIAPVVIALAAVVLGKKRH